MRIAMISMHTSPIEQPGIGDAGGMNVYVLNIARQLAKQGIGVDIFTRATRSSQPEVMQLAENLRVINIIAGPYVGLEKESLPTQLVAFTGGIVQFVNKEARRPETAHLGQSGKAGHTGQTGQASHPGTACQSPYDVIHSHYWLSGQVGWLLRDLWGISLIHTAHTLAAVKNAYRSADDTPESEARRICEQQLVDNADTLVVNTDEEARDLIGHYDAEPSKIVVVPPGADLELFTPGTDRNTERSRRELGIPLHTKVVAFVGRLQKFKGPEVLIRATAELFRREPDRCLRVVVCGGPSGSAASPDYYHNLARELGVAKCIRFIDTRPPEELVSVYQAADIVAVPSYNESFGLVPMEAQACGTPVVAARVGGLPIAVADGETGTLVDGHDPSDWADALADLLDDDDTRIAMGQAAVGHAAQFSWAAAVDKLVDVFQHAIARADSESGLRDRQASGN